MQDRLDEAGELKPRLQRSSGFGLPELELEIRPEPQSATRTLPDLYGVPRLEFLIVDPEFAFVAWEVTLEQLDETRAALGDDLYDARVLQLRLYDSNHAIAGFNLYGDSGRWFLQPALPGAVVSAVLGHASGEKFYELLRRGPLAFPRNHPSGAEHYLELHVEYERGPQGQLLLASRSRKRPQPWPDRLPLAALFGWESAESILGQGGPRDIGGSRGFTAGRSQPGPLMPAGNRDD
jgi:hypothetical protein